MEALRLRVKDVDFAARLLVVREGKGDKDRRTMLPDSLREPLRAQIETTRRLHRCDLAGGRGRVWLPDALERKYVNAAGEFGWQYLFPASRLSVDPRSGAERRHHLEESVVQRAMKASVRAARVEKPASCHTLRHNAGYAARGIIGTPSPPICSMTAMTSERFRSCWVTPT